MTTITREQQKQILIDTANHVISRDNTSPYSENLRELARIALASLEAEPIGAFHIADQQVGGTSDYIKDGEWPIDNGVIEVYAAPPASERERIRREHAEWSDKTFGDVGPVGPLKHLSKEAIEAAAEPDDLSEWADMQFLLWDAQRRAGISDGEITQAMVEKLAVNKQRQWPEPKDGEPRLHIKEQPEPVVHQIMRELVSLLDEDQFARIENIALSAGVMPPQLAPVVPEEIEPDDSNTFDYVDGWNACRAAMLQAGNHTEQHLDMVDHSGDANEKGSDGTFIDEGTKQAGNSPVIPDGWISCSERMPENGQECLVQTNSGWRYVSFYDAHSRLFYDSPKGDIEYILVTHWMPVPAAPKQEVNRG